jgi:predicted RNA methylase
LKTKLVILLFFAFVIGMLLGGVTVNVKSFPYGLIKPTIDASSEIVRSLLNSESANLRNLTLAERDYTETTNEGKLVGDRTFRSKYFDQEIMVPSGVFWPQEAEGEMLPIMSRNPYLFKGKRVLEIGTGTGIVSLYAAQLGAAKVVSTDVSQLAIDTATLNAKNMGFEAIIEARLVPQDDLSAFSVIANDEQFDIIISNPPYAIDLDAPTTTAVIDNGDLGFSIVRGLDQHLAKDGVVVLFYGSSFFHEVMAKFAVHEGYKVRNHSAVGLFPWEAETLYNYYLRRLLKQEGLDEQAFVFNYEKDQALRSDFLKNINIRASDVNYSRLLPGEKGWFWYPGMIIIKHPE